MKKKLLFYLWVSPDFETNPAVKIHKCCLKKYIHVFDELNFIVALDNILDSSNISLAITYLNDICGGREYNLRIVDNIKIRESRVILEDVLPMIYKQDDDLVFMAHSKAITDVNMKTRNPYAALRWVISMYWYNFEYIEELEKKVMDGCSMFGSLQTHFKIFDPSFMLSHNVVYIGNFYWMNPKNMYKNIMFKGIVPMTYNRFLAENLPQLFNLDSLASHNNIITENTVGDLYQMDKEKWLQYLHNYGDADKVFEFQNKILIETIGELGV